MSPGAALQRWLGGAACLLLCGSAEVHAQEQPQNCFWPGSQPRCTSWFITEAGVYVRFTDVIGGDERTLFGANLGWMRNVSRKTALGGEVFAGGEGEGRGGIAIRMRQWLPRRMTFDAVAGVHLLGDASSQDVAAGSPMVTLRWGYADRIGVAARLDVLRLRCQDGCAPSEPDVTSTRLYFGVETGSRLGGALVLLAGVLLGVAAAVLSG